MLTSFEIQQTQQLLLKWFEEYGRDFPWRQTRNPYHVLVAEKLLQQTIARDYVVIAFNAIISKYPTINELAKTSSDLLEPIIQPLGLIYRANELITLADEIVKKHDGIIPNDINSLLSLPGVGDYAARAILVFAFVQDIPIVDTNVARFLHRFLGLQEPISKNPARSRQLRESARSLLPKGKSRDFNFAILDLCALLCKVRSPQCADCPLQENCDYGKTTS